MVQEVKMVKVVKKVKNCLKLSRWNGPIGLTGLSRWNGPIQTGLTKWPNYLS